MRPLVLVLVLASSIPVLAEPWSGRPLRASVATAPTADRALPARLPDHVDPSQSYLADSFDQAGRLTDALPLYRARAEQTRTIADRLRHAGALLRAGRREEARGVYDGVVAEGGSGDHVQLCASSMLREGFPELAVEYLRRGERTDGTDRRRTLLLVRALLAAGDVPAARALIARIETRLDDWDSAELVELARAHALSGRPDAARTLLGRDYPEVLAEMVRDSVQADVSIQEGAWAKAATLLGEAKRKGPATLDEPRVNRSWRNVQRELRWLQLRLALALWKQGNVATATEHARRAALSDEEYVRSSALLLAASAEFAEGRRDAAVRRLEALAGHDPRFRPGVERTKLDPDPSEGATLLADALSSENRAATFVTQPLIDVLREAARRPGEAGGSSGAPAASREAGARPASVGAAGAAPPPASPR